MGKNQANFNTGDRSTLQYIELSLVATLMKFPNFLDYIQFLEPSDFRFYSKAFAIAKENLGKPFREQVMLLFANNAISEKDVRDIELFVEDDFDYLVNLARELKDMLLLVETKGKLQVLAEQKFSSVFEIINHLQSITERVRRTFSLYKDEFSMQDVYQETIKKLTSERKENYNFSIGMVDHQFYDFTPGNTLVIGARPGVGKTAFALWASLNLVAKNIPVHFISMEMNLWQLGLRIFTAVTGIPGTRFFDTRSKNDELLQIDRVSNLLFKLPLKITSEYNPTLEKIEHVIRESVIKYRTKVFFIDYIQLISNPNVESRHLEVASVAQKMKNLAIELDVAIVELSQLARKPNKEPIMADLKESGDIEQAASLIMLLWGEDKKLKEYEEQDQEDNEVQRVIDDAVSSGKELDQIQLPKGKEKQEDAYRIINYKIEKHRNGPLFFGKMIFDINNMAFVEKKMFPSGKVDESSMEKILHMSSIRRFLRENIM